jgi:predicted lipoprotein
MKQSTIKRLLTFILIFGIWNITFAQEKTIVKILNRELKREVKNQLKSSNFNGETIRIIKEFSIDNNKNLSFQIKKTSPSYRISNYKTDSSS